MKKRIYRSMAGLTLVSLLLFGALLALLFYDTTARTITHDVQEKAALLQSVADGQGENLLRIAQMDDPLVDVRMTLLSKEGAVLHDNASESAALVSHASREEFQEAVALGIGESTRFSSTLGSLMYYYALRLPSGEVLRLAKPIASIQGVLWGMLPLMGLMLLLVFLLDNLAATRLTRSILRPLQQYNPDGSDALYDELSPFLRTIAKQQQHIHAQDDTLARHSDTIRSIVASMQEGFLLLDPQGRVLMANPSGLHLLQAKGPGEGKNILELLRDLDLLRHARGALAGERRERVFALGTRTLRVLCSPAPSGGAMLLLMDITEQSQAEKARVEFSANVSHELKTPLTSIRGYAEMLRNGICAPEDTARFGGKIEDEAKRLYALVEDIMKLSEMDEALAPPEREPVEALAVAQEVLASLALEAQEKGISLAAEGDPLPLSFNRVMLYEMVYNLVDNGIKYNKPGGRVTVSLAREGGQGLITVADTGVGIPTEHQEHIFERFYRADKSRSKKNGGTGLGLAIVKHITLLHGGTVQVKSQEGLGTEIRLAFPMERYNTEGGRTASGGL